MDTRNTETPNRDDERHAPDGATPPVLVVDDDRAGSDATSDMLHGGGYHVVAEADGDRVLRLVRRSLVSAVVSELYIACREGRCVVTALKQDRARLPRLSVLVHTRHTSPSDIEWALASGADTVLLKPAREGLLLREVDRLVGNVAAA